MSSESSRASHAPMVSVLVLALVVLAPSAPVAASQPIDFECQAEVTPRVVNSGTVGQSFTLKVSNGPDLPIPLPTEEINLLRVWPPIGLVLPTGASAPSPWATRIVGDPPRILYEDGEIRVGDDEIFSVAADIATETDTHEWSVEASRDHGETGEKCHPAFPGALDITVV